MVTLITFGLSLQRLQPVPSQPRSGPLVSKPTGYFSADSQIVFLFFMNLCANIVHRSIHGLVFRSNKTGTFSTTLSTGCNIQTQIATLPAAPERTKWTLDAQDFQPGSTNTTTNIKNYQILLVSSTLLDASGIESI